MLLEFVDGRRKSVKILVLVLLLRITLKIEYKAFFCLLRNRVVKKINIQWNKTEKGRIVRMVYDSITALNCFVGRLMKHGVKFRCCHKSARCQRPFTAAGSRGRAGWLWAGKYAPKRGRMEHTAFCSLQTPGFTIAAASVASVTPSAGGWSVVYCEDTSRDFTKIRF